MKFSKTFLSITLMGSMLFSSAGAAYAGSQTPAPEDPLTFEQLFPDPYFAELIAHHAGCEISDIAEQEALDRITCLTAFDNDQKIVEDVFDLTGIGSLQNLEEIDLSGMAIASIPSEIGELEFLRKADFSDNQIVYVSAELVKLEDLEELHLDRNRIGAFPDGLSALPNLTDYTAEEQDTSLGNVPVRFIPQSRITFREDGEPVLTEVSKSVPDPRGAGVDLDALLGSRERSEEEDKKWTPIEELPVYRYEESYVAAEGTVAQYGSGGSLCHVWGDCEYTCNIEQYEVDGELPDGRFISDFSEFSQETIPSRAASSTKKSGVFTTYGEDWPTLSSKYPKPDNGKIPSSWGLSAAELGQRVGTKDNVLQIGDVAVKSDIYRAAGFDAAIEVTVMASDTNGSGQITHTMYIRDKMSSSVKAVLDIWRWDNPDWFTGESQSPNNKLFGQKWNSNLSFENKNNYFEY